MGYLPIEFNHWRAAPMTGSARNCLGHLLTLALDMATRLVPAFGTYTYYSKLRCLIVLLELSNYFLMKITTLYYFLLSNPSVMYVFYDTI